MLVRILFPNQIPTLNSESFPSVQYGERGSNADDTGRLCELRGNHHHQIHQPLKRVGRPESLKLPTDRYYAIAGAILHDGSLQQGSDHISIGPVGVLAAKSLCETPRARSKLEVDAVAHGEWVLLDALLALVLALLLGPC